jgi:hypothetical protein
MPARLAPRMAAPLGCFVLVLAYLAVCLVLFAISRWWLWLILALPATLPVVIAIATVTTKVVGFVFLLLSRPLQRRGVRCLVIYSESPAWHDHIQQVWLPRLGPHAATLNWSQRSEWPWSLEVRLFKHFVASSRRNFNPAVLVFRGLRRPAVYRFFYAFQEANRGRPQYLHMLEDELFIELGT